MTAKDFLWQYKRACTRIRQAESELEYIEAQIQSISGSGDGMPRGTDISDRTGNIAVLLAEQRACVEAVKAEAVRARLNVARVINAVENPLQSQLLYDRYILGMPWREIAEDLPASEEYTRGRLHGKALESIRKIIGEE